VLIPVLVNFLESLTVLKIDKFKPTIRNIGIIKETKAEKRMYKLLFVIGVQTPWPGATEAGKPISVRFPWIRGSI
jgi:hypothetical protein